MHPTLAQAMDMHQFIWCQIARGIHYSTIVVQLPEEARSQAQGLVVQVLLLVDTGTRNRMVERLYSYFILISDKVHIYSGKGRKVENGSPIV